MLFVLACVACAYLLGRCGSKVEQGINSDAYDALNGYLLSQTITTDGTQQTTAAVAQITPEQLSELSDSITAKVKNDLGSEFKRLQTAKIIETKTVIEKTVPIYDTVFLSKTDTVFGKRFSYQDSWTDLTGLIVNDSVSLDYKTHAELRLYTHWQSNGLFKGKTLIAKTATDNPHLVVTSARNIVVPYKAKWHQKRGVRIASAIVMFGLGTYLGTQLQ